MAAPTQGAPAQRSAHSGTITGFSTPTWADNSLGYAYIMYYVVIYLELDLGLTSTYSTQQLYSCSQCKSELHTGNCRRERSAQTSAAVRG